MKAKQILLASSLLLATGSQAGEVSITPFVGGEAATAESVNAAFDTLIIAVTDNSQRIAALESNQTADVAGRTYYLSEVSSSLASDNAGNAGIANYAATGTVTLAADGTFSVTSTEYQSEIDTPRGGIFVSPPETSTMTGTYTQVNEIVTFSFPDEGEDEGAVFNVSPDGSVLTWTKSLSGSDDDYPSWIQSESIFVVCLEAKP